MSCICNIIEKKKKKSSLLKCFFISSLQYLLSSIILLITDGVSYISNRQSKANNKYLKSYDSKQESKDIIYLHTNNLYDYAMSKFLPTSGFKWIDPK